MTTPIPRQPGEALRDLLEERGISQIRAAQVLGISRGHLNSIINGHNPISADLKLKLQDFLNVPPQHWTRLQDRQDEFAASPEGRAHLEQVRRQQFLEQLQLQPAERLGRTHVHEAVACGWLGITPYTPAQLLPGGYYWLGLGQHGFTTRLKDPAKRPAETPVDLRPSLELAPGEHLSVLSHEKLRLPEGLNLRVASRGTVFSRGELRLECDWLVPAGLDGGLALHIVNESGRPQTLRFQQQALLIQFEYNPEDDPPGFS